MEFKDEPKEKRIIEWLHPRPKMKNTNRSKAHVEVYGSWNNFSEPTKLEYKGHGVFSCEVEVLKFKEY